MLKGSELETAESRAKCRFTSRFRVLPKNYGIYAGEKGLRRRRDRGRDRYAELRGLPRRALLRPHVQRLLEQFVVRGRRRAREGLLA